MIPINQEITVKSAATCVRALFNITGSTDTLDMKENQRNGEILELKNDVEILLKEAILEKGEAADIHSILEVLLVILNTNQTARLGCFNWFDTILEKDKIDENINLIQNILDSTAHTINQQERDVGIKIITKITNQSQVCFNQFIQSLNLLLS